MADLWAAYRAAQSDLPGDDPGSTSYHLLLTLPRAELVDLRPGTPAALRRVIRTRGDEGGECDGGVLWGCGGDTGRAVHVDTIKPTVKAPGTDLLTLNCCELLSTLAFKFNLRRYTLVPQLRTTLPHCFSWSSKGPREVPGPVARSWGCGGASHGVPF